MSIIDTTLISHSLLHVEVIWRACFKIVVKMVGGWSRENMKKAQSSFNKDIVSLSQILLELQGVDSVY
jgi:hypothetical protein